MTTAPESTVRRRELGRRLFASQKKVGFKGTELAALASCHLSQWSRTIHGRRSVTTAEVVTALTLCGVTGPQQDDVLRLCEPHQDSSLRLPCDQAWSAFVADAGQADRVVEFQPLMVPWLVQTPDYTRALLTGPGRDSAGCAPVGREDASFLLSNRSVELLLHESVLRTPVGDEEVMSDQLHHLLRVSVLHQVFLRVVPVERGGWFGCQSGFTLVEFPDYRPVLYREDLTEGVLVDEPADVAAYVTAARYLGEVALDRQQSRELIGKVAVDLYGGGVLEQFERKMRRRRDAVKTAEPYGLNTTPHAARLP